MGYLISWEVGKASLEDALLRAAHAGCIAPRMIIIAIQMQESMNDVEGQFAVHTVAVLPGIERGGLCAGHDLAMLKGDDVRGAGDVHETPVHIGDDPVGNDGDLDLVQGAQGKTAVGGMAAASFEGVRGELAQPWQAEAHGALAIVDVDAQAAETGGTVGREVGIGVSRRSERDSVRESG